MLKLDHIVFAIQYYSQSNLILLKLLLHLNLLNLSWFVKNMPFLDEVSIGHALMSDALYYGIENSIQMYLKEINKGNK